MSLSLLFRLGLIWFAYIGLRRFLDEGLEDPEGFFLRHAKRAMADTARLARTVASAAGSATVGHAQRCD